MHFKGIGKLYASIQEKDMLNDIKLIGFSNIKSTTLNDSTIFIFVEII